MAKENMDVANRATSSPIKYYIVVYLTAAITWSLSSMVHQCWRSEEESHERPAAVALMDSFTTKRSNEDSGPSRVWTKFEGNFPCYPGEKELMVTEPASEGFLFHRPMKVGSTTVVGVVIRLAHNRSPWLKSRNITCKHRSMHGSGLQMGYDERDRSKSFLFSLIRDPTKRAISEFFHFLVGVHNTEPTDKNFQQFLRSSSLQHRYINDLRVNRYNTNITNENLTQSFLQIHGLQDKSQLHMILKKRGAKASRFQKLHDEHMQFGPNASITRIVEDILDGYDFIAVTERMDESLVALQMLLNLTTKDILYTHSRGSGTFSNGPPGTPCIFIPHSFLTPGIKSYFQSDEWKKIIRGDLMLHRAAQASLDRTISALGEKEFKQNLHALKKGLKIAEENCKGRVRTLCTDGGQRINFRDNTCYIWGEGCDHECIDELYL